MTQIRIFSALSRDFTMSTRERLRSVLIVTMFCGPVAAAEPRPPIDARDWPTYNGDVLGTRHNAGETSLSAKSVARLEEKWRFPPKGADFQIGAIHATPAVVNGYVYFGTANCAAFYKLTPDGKVKWRHQLNPDVDRTNDLLTNGVYGAALVTDDSVYFGTVAGFIYALDRETGKERWRLDLQGKAFPGAHRLNATFASPILADGKIIIAGGALEQVVHSFLPFYEGHTGRGFVAALEPQSGRVVWKYDVGVKPERLDPPIKIKDAWGEYVFHHGPSTSTVWSTPSYDAASHTIYFGTDANNSPRRPTKDDPRLDTRHACAIIAIDSRDGMEKWVTQLNSGDIWNTRMRAYDPDRGRYLDQSIGDTPKIYTIDVDGKSTRVVGAGCKNGGFYVLRAADGKVLHHTPLYTGKPAYPLNPPPDKRVLALPSPIGGLQTGCATDGKSVFTNGIDALLLGTQETRDASKVAPTAGRVTAISLDTRDERWRHERPKVATAGGPPPKPVLKNIGDPVASGIAVANGVVYFTTLVSSKLVALDAASGKVLRELDLPPVWSGPAVSRGRVYVGTGSIIIADADFFCPRQSTGILFSFGLPDEPKVSPAPSEQMDQLKKLGARITLDEQNRVIGVNLGERRVTDADLIHLKGLQHLQELDLTRTRITSAGLVNIKGLSTLRRLFLTDTKVDDSGIVHLKGMTALTLVGLSGTRITDAALDDLHELKGLKQLFCLGTGVTGAGVEKLGRALPQCLIAH